MMGSLCVASVALAEALIVSKTSESDKPPPHMLTSTPMKTRNILFATLAWFQLGVSLLLATAIIWGYMTFQVSIGQFIKSLAASVEAVSTVVVRTAESVDARQDMLEETQRLLEVTRKLITELKTMATNQKKLAPQYAKGLKETSSLLGTLAGPLHLIGEKFTEISIPNIQFVGIKPVVTMTKPLEDQGRQLKESSGQVKAVGLALAGISVSIDQDAQNVSVAFIDMSDHAIKVIEETEKTLTSLKTQELPKTIADLKTTSENLHRISTQVEQVSNVGLVMLVVGLLLALWCVAHSLGALLLVRSHAFGSKSDDAPTLVNS